MAYTLTDAADVVFETNGDDSHFFGYYDKSPLDRSGTRLLSHRVDFDGREVRADDTATLGYWDIESGDFTPLGTTNAFNWQQGSMLQWLPPSYDRCVVYNDRREESYVSVIVDISTGEETVLPRPIYAIHPSGEYALAVNFERFHFCRPGYNYKGVENPKWDQPMHEDDGIYRLNLETGESTQIISTPEVCAIDPKPVFEQRDNWLEHVLWNPSGTHFAFFHRWDDGQGGHKTRLFTAAPDGSDLYMFPDSEFYSHMGWRNDEWFTIWTSEPSLSQDAVETVQRYPLLKRLVKPFYYLATDHLLGGDTGTVLPDKTFVEFRNQTEQFELLGDGAIRENGHNTWKDDERWMLTDTYALAGNEQHLRLWDDHSGQLHDLATFEATYPDSVYRCDLHPRWGHDETCIVVDTAHDERRQMIVLEPDFDRLSGDT